MASIDLIPLSPEHVTLVTLADEAARAKLQVAEQRHKAAYLEEMRTIQAAFVAVVQPVLDTVRMGAADTARLTHDDNGVLCLEVVRRTTPLTPSDREALAATSDGAP